MSAWSARPRKIAAPLARAGTILASLALSASSLAATTTEIYKCTDRSGNVTYQNEKCPTGSQAGRVDIFDNNWTASRAEKNAEWQRNAADRRVVTGMPAHWVREGFGDPAEVRDTTTGGAKELWVYNLPDRTLQIGMLDDQVQWFRETPTAPVPGFVQAPAAPAAPSSSAAASPSSPTPRKSAAPATSAAPRPIDILQAPDSMRSLDPALTGESARKSESPRSVETQRTGEPASESAAPRAVEAPRATEAPAVADASRRIARGRDCREVLTELGKPDRQREIPGEGGSSAMTEYLYEPSGSADPTRTRILCANGRVEGVDRSVAH